MNILFLTITRIKEISERGIYTDLLRKFRDEGHDVYVACPAERKYKEPTSYKFYEGVHLLNIWTLNAQKTNLLEKGLSILLLDVQFKAQIKKYFADVKFDLLLFSTPPITFTSTITYIKNRDNATTYLLLKDIFPQNAVDLGMIGKDGFIYSYFRKREIKLYQVSDFIGCLSPANEEYLIKHNPEINRECVEVNPNSINPTRLDVSEVDRYNIRECNNIPQNATVFIYGGNLGKPQGVDFLLKVLISSIDILDVFILIVGSGTELPRLLKWQTQMSPKNVRIIPGLPKNEYDDLVKACDVGLVFLDERFTIPNFPSRLLTYLENKMPVLAATDVNTDLGKIIVDAGCGFWVRSGDIAGFNKQIRQFVANPAIIKEMGEKAYELLMDQYTVETSYAKIMSRTVND